jgi:hypothetical protein
MGHTVGKCYILKATDACATYFSLTNKISLPRESYGIYKVLSF